MVTLLIVVIAVTLGSLAGYWIHRALHEPWTGPFYRGHREHHEELYPTTRLTSERYEVSKWYNSGPVLFTPGAILLLIVGALVTWILGISMRHFVAFGVSLVGFGLLNDYIHDSFHLRKHFLQKFSYYRKLRRLHFLHHFNVEKNYGIVSLHWDAVFKTKKG